MRVSDIEIEHYWKGEPSDLYLPDLVADLRDLRKMAREVVARLDWITTSPNLQDLKVGEIVNLYGNELSALRAALEEGGK